MFTGGAADCIIDCQNSGRGFILQTSESAATLIEGLTIRNAAAGLNNGGDMNRDGQITAADAQLAFQIVLGQYSPTYQEDCAADCNGDGSVTAADVQAILLTVPGQGTCADPL